ncbi:hypothetical protein AB4Z52_35605 [Rhizobium sp. 2YAF20]
MSTDQTFGHLPPQAAAALATLDRKLADAVRKEGVAVLGPFAHGD